MADSLNIWMNGQHVGVWGRSRGGRDWLRYEHAWRDSERARPLSLSLPLTVGDAPHRGDAVAYYFDNLLPDDARIRERLRMRFHTRSSDTFDLLEALGRDCVGAVQLLPLDETPQGWDRIDSEPLTTGEVERILRSVPSSDPETFGGAEESEDIRFSIAGAQEKTALLRVGNRWHRPRGATPTSHILKLPLGLVGGLKLDLRHSVDNEWLCAALLRELGFEVAETQIGRFGEQRVLVVKRFDRGWRRIGEADPDAAHFKPPKGAWLARIPQEDFCQVTATPHDRKYERDGGPGIQQILGILAGSAFAEDDRLHFARTQLAFWILAAIDGHAKNFSIFHLAHSSYALTPLYDVLSAWPVIGHGTNKIALERAKLAMALRSKSAHYRLQQIQPRHFHTLAARLGDSRAWPAMKHLAAEVPAAIARVERHLPRDLAESVWTAVTKGAVRQAAAFETAAQTLAA